MAAYSVEERRAVADPFTHSAAAVSLLETRARMITGSGGRGLPTPRGILGLRASGTGP